MFQLAPRMSPKHHDVVCEEIDEIFKARFITPATSAWSFSVGTATKKHAKPRLCVNFQLLGARVNGNRLQLEKIEQIFNELPRSAFS